MTRPLPLDGVRIFDLTRILAGPTCTQLLGDLGADVIKIERPGVGDITRGQLRDVPNADSLYFTMLNHNKRSITLDLGRPEGIALAKRLLAECDVLVENFKVGSLAKLGLGYEQLREEFPRLVYCSVTGFGQTGPYAKRAGYDFLAQGLGGIMSITGTPGVEPVKVGVGIADVMTGMYAATSILAALRHRDRTGEGQHVDCCLLDTQVSWLVNEGTNYLVSGKVPKPLGNAHPNIVPYQVFPSADGHVILACGNDGQFRRWCEVAGAEELRDDPRFAGNPLRIRNRDALIPLMLPYMAARTTDAWIAALEAAGVPCGPVNTIDRVFEDPQVKARGMRIELPHPLAGSGSVPLIANPVKFSGTPIEYRHAPPTLGEHTDEVLAEVLGMSAEEIAAEKAKGAV